MNVTFEVLIILALVLVNGLFAMTEIALVSARKSRLRNLAEEGNARARVALDLASSPNRFLSTVQIGITLIGILAGAFGGATVAERISEWAGQFTWLAPYSQAVGLAAVVLVITFLTLLIGELVPKRIGLHSPEGISMAMAKPMFKLSRLTHPLVQALSMATDGILKLLGITPRQESPVTEEEVRTLIEQGLHAGVFDRIELQMLEGVLRLDQLYVRSIMTPRPRIVWINLDDPDELNWRKIVGSGHSHFPVFQEQRDNVVGMLSVKALWANKALADKAEIKNLLTEPVYVPSSMAANKLLETFKQTGKHIALVTDEFGGIQGLVTLIDVLEAIVGEIPSKEQPRQKMFSQREDGSYLCDGAMETQEVKDLLQLKKLPAEEEGEFQTLAGFLLHHLGRIPKEGEYFETLGYRFEVVDLDRHRIDKVLVSRTAKTRGSQTNN
jgi:putative hemolysin